MKSLLTKFALYSAVFQLAAHSLGAVEKSDAYRYRDNRYLLESAQNKGLKGSKIAPASPLKFPRERPLPSFAKEAREEKAGRFVREKVEVKLTSSGSVDVGFPLPQGGVFSPKHLRVLNARGEEIAAQIRVLSFWPDQSIRWASLQFSTDEPRFTVEFGSEVSQKTFASPLKVEQEEERLKISTGKLEVVVNLQRFNGLESVIAEGKSQGGFASEGFRLERKEGEYFDTAARPPKRWSIEQEGVERVVIRVEGDYFDAEGNPWMSYVTRLSFRAGSSEIGIAHRHINTALDHEFSDFRSLQISYHIPGKGAEGRTTLGANTSSEKANPLQLLQENDRRAQLSLGDKVISLQRSRGILEIEGTAGTMGLHVEDFWQRWPKSLTLKGQKLTLGLLPTLPNAEFGKDLPPHLIYPFVDGDYRLKWGMAFTERFTLNYGAGPRADASPIALIPSEWYAKTRALGPLAAYREGEFAEWDAFFERGYLSWRERQEENREYGFLNYGDWFGERGRNWGNNEYDTAHAFFMQFARTGNVNYYHLALSAARHQADSDIVHAYPDPAYIGANPQHSVGHTGEWSHVPKQAAWSYPYDIHSNATNGHTWAEGMTEAWWLAGDAMVMESALLLGEHIAWAVAPGFEIFLSYPRSAGWSLRAILALHAATADPAYLKAAQSIAASAISTQRPEGFWPKQYRKAKTGAEGGSKASEPLVGISNFQLGLMVAALSVYDEADGSDVSREAVRRGAELLAKAWPGSGGWPYDIGPDGAPVAARLHQSLTTGIMNAESLVYIGNQEKNIPMLNIAQEVMLNTFFFEEPVARRQRASLLLRSGSALIAGLQQAYDAGLIRPVKDDPSLYFKGVRPARKFDLRGPGKMVLMVRTAPGAKEVRFQRRAEGPGAKGKGKASIRLFSAEKEELLQVSVPAEEGTESFSVPLPGEDAAIYRVEIDEPFRGIWTPDMKGLSGVLLSAETSLRLTGVSLVSFQLWIPAEASEVAVKVASVHAGAYGVALLSREGEVIGYKRHGENTRQSDEYGMNGGKIALSEKERGQLLPFVLWGAGDVEMTISGVPGWIARTPEEWFPLPKEVAGSSLGKTP